MIHYEGPVYRPPSEADSLLIQATIGCPHNRCTFCMVYKKGPRYRVRTYEEIENDLHAAREEYGSGIKTIFFPAGNTIAMPTEKLARICRLSHSLFPDLQRITVYGSAQYIHRKGPEEMKYLRQAGLKRIHVGLESGCDRVLKKIKKGSDSSIQIQAGQAIRQARIELSLYVLLGIAGREESGNHARESARVINEIRPDFIRLRTFVPKYNTPLLEDVRKGDFQMLGPHEVLRETALILENIRTDSILRSDHYTNYLNLEGRLPEDGARLQEEIRSALNREEKTFRPFFIGTE